MVELTEGVENVGAKENLNLGVDDKDMQENGAQNEMRLHAFTTLVRVQRRRLGEADTDGSLGPRHDDRAAWTSFCGQTAWRQP